MKSTLWQTRLDGHGRQTMMWTHDAASAWSSTSHALVQRDDDGCDERRHDEAAHHGGPRRPMACDSYIRGRAAARAEAGRGGRGLERSRLFAEPGRELFVRLEALECELERWPKEVPGTTWRFWAS